MTLEEALMVKKMINGAKKTGRKTTLPAHLILMAGATESFCRTRKVTKLTADDMKDAWKVFNEKWLESGKNDTEAWIGKLNCEKILENEGVKLVWEEAQSEETEGNPDQGVDPGVAIVSPNEGNGVPDQ